MIGDVNQTHSVSATDIALEIAGPNLGKTDQKIKSILLEKPASKSTLCSKLKIAGYAAFAPITIPLYLINKGLSKIAISNGLGDKKALKFIDKTKREALKALGGEEVLFGFSKKTTLEGMFFEPPTALETKKTILICSGSHKSFENYTVPMVKAFLSKGFQVMVFNYQGFGKSDGTASEAGVYKSTQAAFEYLKQVKGCKEENIVVWGYSLGSGAATNLASKHKVDLVIDRGFSSMSEVAYHAAPSGMGGLARFIFRQGADFDNLKKIQGVTGNILIAQGIYDSRMMSEYHGELLKEATSENAKAQYLEIDAGHHHTDDTLWIDDAKYIEPIQSFLTKE
jgi:hypothetical protein